jgi:KaiC/GvpD/RAD55 family RecA-like ATPase
VVASTHGKGYDMLKFIKTNISKAYWCSYNKGVTEFEAAKIHSLGISGFGRFHSFLDEERERLSRNDISWFDNLFDGGGMKISGENGKPITLLISGPPGSGKTTLALELCLRSTINHGFWSLYVSTESATDLVLDKVTSLSIKHSGGKTVPFDGDLKQVAESAGALTVYGQENIKRQETFTEIVELALEDVIRWLAGSESSVVKRLFNIDLKTVPKASPDILVFDSLNMVETDKRRDLFERIISKIRDRTKLVVVILDTGKHQNSHENWEFACDNILRLNYDLIRLDSTSMRDYYIRYIEVIKSRYQAHVWGKQQMKIYTSYDLPGRDDPDCDSIMRRAHPYREEGGIFIYPSIHFFLSRYKRAGTTFGIRPIATPCSGLNQVIEGFPDGRCTALMGIRGGHKSHLGYLHILQQVVTSYKQGGQNEVALIVSLRDDEQMTRQHLVKILKENILLERHPNKPFSKLTDKERKLIENDAEQLLTALERDNLLEILYYPPGYITPDEFFHRMFMSIYRFKYGSQDENAPHADRNITLLFNSLDQLAARFPLCAHQPIFIPAMIQSLSGENVTSIFIAVDEPGQPPTQYGLLPMADLILTFGRYKIREVDYYCHHGKKGQYAALDEKKGSRDEIILEVSRFSGGQRAGVKGLLELVYSDKTTDSLLANKPGLHFTVWEHDILKSDIESLTGWKGGGWKGGQPLTGCCPDKI